VLDTNNSYGPNVNSLQLICVVSVCVVSVVVTLQLQQVVKIYTDRGKLSFRPSPRGGKRKWLKFTQALVVRPKAPEDYFKIWRIQRGNHSKRNHDMATQISPST
jgi:hypothetical protein